jgi:biopolymer transport protein ExbB
MSLASDPASDLTQQSFGLARYWSQGDAISHVVACALLLMSLISWYYILSKLWSSWRIRNSAGALAAFWKAPDLPAAIAQLGEADREDIYAPLARQSAQAALSNGQVKSLDAEINADERITRHLRDEITRASLRMEGGLTLLASIGATAPFVGLLGTVWGIYHALAAVSAAGTAEVDKIAGPVGEALIMTALGLAVAIPAVLAYNGFTRINRITLTELDGFAHDLHAYLTKTAE